MVETVDTDNPGNYLEGKNSIPFEVIEEKLKIKDKGTPGGYREEKIKVRLTRRIRWRPSEVGAGNPGHRQDVLELSLWFNNDLYAVMFCGGGDCLETLGRLSQGQSVGNTFKYWDCSRLQQS
jgi:hypothetical protein